MYALSCSLFVLAPDDDFASFATGATSTFKLATPPSDYVSSLTGIILSNFIDLTPYKLWIRAGQYFVCWPETGFQLPVDNSVTLPAWSDIGFTGTVYATGIDPHYGLKPKPSLKYHIRPSTIPSLTPSSVYSHPSMAYALTFPPPSYIPASLPSWHNPRMESLDRDLQFYGSPSRIPPTADETAGRTFVLLTFTRTAGQLTRLQFYTNSAGILVYFAVVHTNNGQPNSPLVHAASVPVGWNSQSSVSASSDGFHDLDVTNEHIWMPANSTLALYSAETFGQGTTPRLAAAYSFLDGRPMKQFPASVQPVGINAGFTLKPFFSQTKFNLPPVISESPPASIYFGLFNSLASQTTSPVADHGVLIFPATLASTPARVTLISLYIAVLTNPTTATLKVCSFQPTHPTDLTNQDVQFFRAQPSPGYDGCSNSVRVTSSAVARLDLSSSRLLLRPGQILGIIYENFAIGQASPPFGLSGYSFSGPCAESFLSTSTASCNKGAASLTSSLNVQFTLSPLSESSPLYSGGVRWTPNSGSGRNVTGSGVALFGDTPDGQVNFPTYLDLNNPSDTGGQLFPKIRSTIFRGFSLTMWIQLQKRFEGNAVILYGR